MITAQFIPASVNVNISTPTLKPSTGTPVARVFVERPLYEGATVNRNERFSYVLEGVDVLAVGHTHKGTVTKPSKICVDQHHNMIQQKSMTVISACSWLSYGGYALNKMLLPSQAQDVEHPQTVLLGGLRDKRFIKTIW